jgi:hypothetical protein
MADNELKQYPRGQISLGKGDLQQCSNFEWDYTNNGKLLATLRANPSGVVTGTKAVSFTGETHIDEDGPERDYFDLVDTGKAQQARVKLPGGTTKTIQGVITRVKGRLTLEDGVQITFEGVGKFVK